MRMPVRLPDRTPGGVDFVALGECSLDVVAVLDRWPRSGEKRPLRGLTYSPGGQAATAAVACQRLGWASRFLGCVGDDWAADRALATAKAEGVDVRVARRLGVATRQAVVLVEAGGSDRTVLESRDTRLAFTLSELGGDAVVAGRILLVDTTEIGVAIQAAQGARRQGQPVMVDVDAARPGTDDLLRLVDVLIVPHSAIAELSGTGEPGAGLGRLVSEFGSAIAVATLGVEGVLAVSEGREFRTAAPAVEAVDTTGAGDVFRGAFAAGWLRYGREADLAQVFRYAVAAAAWSCRSFGAQQGLPRHADISGSV